jgi:hypothetical protein
VPEVLGAGLAVELSGFDASCARVLFLNESAGLGIAVIDTNGDGREIEASLYEVGSNGQWRELVSGIGSGWTDDVVWQCGYAPSATSVRVRYAATTREVPVIPETGMWYFAAHRVAGDDRTEPALLPEGPPNEPRT